MRSELGRPGHASQLHVWLVRAFVTHLTGRIAADIGHLAGSRPGDVPLDDPQDFIEPLAIVSHLKPADPR